MVFEVRESSPLIYDMQKKKHIHVHAHTQNLVKNQKALTQVASQKIFNVTNINSQS